MTWFFLAILGPVLYAATNHIDQILLQKYFVASGPVMVVVFSSLLAGLSLPVFYALNPQIFGFAPLEIAVILAVGVINTSVLWFYLLALREEEATIVVIFYQLVPVLGLGIGYVTLGEVISTRQLIAMGVIILGAITVSFEVNAEQSFRLRKSTLLYMILASLGWAGGSVLFKFVALEQDTWPTLFWEHAVFLAIGLGLLAFSRPVRTQFLSILRLNSNSVLFVNVVNETLYISGNIATASAYVLAPVSLVLLMNAFQPIFVLLIGLTLPLIWPSLPRPDVSRIQMTQKLVAILITGIGTYVLLGS